MCSDYSAEAELFHALYGSMAYTVILPPTFVITASAFISGVFAEFIFHTQFWDSTQR